MLLTILIIFFTSIILYKILFYIRKSSCLIEGMEERSKEYNNYGDDPMILAQQNAGNIEFLKTRVDDISNVKGDVEIIKQDLKTVQIQVDGLVQQQADMANELSGGGEPLSVGGLDEEQEAQEEEEEQEDDE